MDMGMYDTKANNCPELVDRLAKCEKDLLVCHNNMEKIALSALHSNTTTVAPQVETKPMQGKTTSEVFLKRHVNHLLSRLGLRSPTNAHLKVEIQLSAFQVQTLQNFVSQQSSIHAVDVDQILSSFIKSVDTYERSLWIEIIKVIIT